MQIKSGEKIPADIRLFVTSNFKVDNASLTGESLPQTRTPDNTHESALEATNLCFYGTLATNGNARGVVIRTGDRTVIGTIANLAASTGNVQTPIAIEIEHFIHVRRPQLPCTCPDSSCRSSRLSPCFWVSPFC